MIKYYKLFDLLNRKNMKKTDLLNIISSPTLAKLSKGEIIKTDIIDKICIYLHCQPSDIMECIIMEEYDKDYTKQIIPKNEEKDYISYMPKNKIEEYEPNEYRIGTERQNKE